MTEQSITDIVREKYGNAARQVTTGKTSCCGTAPSASGLSGDPITSNLYGMSEQAQVPEQAFLASLGCGNPTALAKLEPGEVVLDLGSGGGIDCFLASKMVGETGRVFGVDMTPEMIALARRNAEKVGATNVEFRQGQIEALPIGDATVDVIISNCVINLSPDKDAVFREAFRVLKPGGRLQVSDVVWKQPVPENVKNDMEKWAGCIAGALVETDYLAKIAAAGFEQITSDATEYPGGQGVASAAVVAVRPS